MAIKLALKLMNNGGAVVDETWKSWKVRHMLVYMSDIGFLDLTPKGRII